jgi:AcrR family transcriptional regulator
MTAARATAERDDQAPHASLAFRAARNASAELTRTSATPAAAFLAARRMYLKGQRVDMLALAAELGVSRATLYRWTGHRERLLADILWSLSDEVFEQAKADHREHTGAERLLAIFPQHLGVREETRAALRILTSREGGVQSRTVEKLAELYREEQESGAFTPRTDVGTLAYAVVRVTEGFIYSDAIVGGAEVITVEPEIERAAEIVALLLE